MIFLVSVMSCATSYILCSPMEEPDPSGAFNKTSQT